MPSESRSSPFFFFIVKRGQSSDAPIKIYWRDNYDRPKKDIKKCISRLLTESKSLVPSFVPYPFMLRHPVTWLAPDSRTIYIHCGTCAKYRAEVAMARLARRPASDQVNRPKSKINAGNCEWKETGRVQRLTGCSADDIFFFFTYLIFFLFAMAKFIFWCLYRTLSDYLLAHEFIALRRFRDCVLYTRVSVQAGSSRFGRFDRASANLLDLSVCNVKKKNYWCYRESD